jgi:Porin subfamily
MKTMKTLLLGSAAGLVAVTGGQAADLPVKAKPVEYVKICPLYGAGFYYVPGTDTCLKLGGYVRFQAESDASGGTIFMSGANALYTRTDTPNLSHRVRTAFTWDSRTQTEYGTLRMYFRGGWEQTTPGTPDETVFWDRGFIQFAGFTVGRAESFFDHFSFGPYSYATNARISGNQTVESRGITLFGYTAQLGNGFTASLSIEDGGNSAAGAAGNNARARGHSVLDLDAPVAGGIGNNVVAFANATSTLTPDNGSSSVPDIVGNIRVDQAWGSAQLSGALHLNSAGYYSGFVPGACIPGNSTTCDNPDDEIGWAVGGSIIVNLPMLAPGDTIGGMVTYSEGAIGYANRDRTFRLWHHGDSNGGLVSSYGVGFAGDSVFRNPGSIPGYAGELELTRAWSVVAAAQHFWTRQLRTSVYGGFAAVEYTDVAKGLICPAGAAVPAGFIPFGTSGLIVTNCDPDYSVWAIGSRTQWNPHPYLDIGVEVLWTHLNTAFAGPGATNAAQGANPAQVVNIEDQDVLSVMGRVQYNFLP